MNTARRDRPYLAIPGAPAGFTLVELIIAVAIAGLLAAVALPAYRSQVLRTHRTVAKTALVEAASRQESYFIGHKTYATSLAALQLKAYLARDGSQADSSTGEAIYQLSIGARTTGTCPATGSATAAGYTIVATPVGTQTRDSDCATLCLTSNGIKLASAGTAANCWNR